MRTQVVLENSNCTRCHNQLVEELRSRERVRRVQSDFSAGCLVIDHDEEPEVLISLIERVGRAVGVAANGERVMVSVEAHEEGRCPVSKPDARPPTRSARRRAPGPRRPAAGEAIPVSVRAVPRHPRRAGRHEIRERER